MNTEAGLLRLAKVVHVLGMIWVAAWIVISFYDGLTRSSLMIGSVFGGIGYGIAWAVAWVIRGFAEKNK